ncbi:hypothetical protein QR680_000671 [Steinernema hermaphroditum]|uniref:Uncharacterized protein n=1 Tax=Steinernema hermaphroditum TaxID=289476 RepID=A0AA39LEG9_9BILA|nr:hypothetical protein QR680_000671 [Steinernema hermaphroditum]
MGIILSSELTMNTLVLGAALFAVALGYGQSPVVGQQPYYPQNPYPPPFVAPPRDNVWCDTDSTVFVATERVSTGENQGPYGGNQGNFVQQVIKSMKCSTSAWFDEKSCTSCCRLARRSNDINTLDITGMVVEIGGEELEPENPGTVYGRKRRQAEPVEAGPQAPVSSNQPGYSVPTIDGNKNIVVKKELQCLCCRPTPSQPSQPQGPLYGSVQYPQPQPQYPQVPVQNYK